MTETTNAKLAPQVRNAPTVLIAGAGPTGLTLACELARRGVSFRLIEAVPGPQPGSRGKGIQPRTLEVFGDLGIVDRVLANGRMAMPTRSTASDGQVTLGGAVPEALRDRPDIPYPASLITPEWRIEEALRLRLAELGGTVEFGTALGRFEQPGEGVSAVVVRGGEAETVTARWLAGCDGGRSLVRRLLGVGFPGEPAHTEWLLAELEVTMPPGELAAVSDEVRKTHKGFGIGPAGNGLHRAVVPAATVSEDRVTPPTLEEFRTQLLAYAGTDFGVHSPRWLSRFTDATRLASQYREGRVFLAGDAAHVHPPLGGQGLNLGIQDAFNLGWKLAAEVNGWAPEGLLDSYFAERHPVAADVLDITRVQSELISPEPGPQAVRRLLAELMDFEDVSRFLMERVTGIGIRYDFGEGRQLIGRRLRDIRLSRGRLYELMHQGRGLLLDQAGKLSVEGWADRVDHVIDVSDELDVPAVLLRPDGHVAWTGDDQQELLSHLPAWFGARASRD